MNKNLALDLVTILTLALFSSSHVGAEIVLCKSFLGFVKAREGSCKRHETLIPFPIGNAETNCGTGELLDGDGNCIPTPVNTDTVADLNCNEGEIAKFVGGSWTCASDDDTTIPASDTLGDLSCSVDQIAQYNGTTWVCADPVNIAGLLDAVAKLVFATSVGFNGNMVTSAQTLFPGCSGVSTGTGGADCICQELAEAAGFSGTYLAWLANGVAPNSRFTQSFDQPYVRTDGKLVAEDWNDLTDATIANPIAVDENGNQVPSSLVWSGVGTNGASDIIVQDCGEWTSGVGSSTGAEGRANLANQGWTLNLTGGPCNQEHLLYCFEQ